MRHPDASRDVPLVLRNVPVERRDLARRLAGDPGLPGDVWWELVDPACPADRRPVGVALTRTGAPGVVQVAAEDFWFEPGSGAGPGRFALELSPSGGSRRPRAAGRGRSSGRSPPSRRPR